MSEAIPQVVTVPAWMMAMAAGHHRNLSIYAGVLFGSAIRHKCAFNLRTHARPPIVGWSARQPLEAEMMKQHNGRGRNERT